MTFPIVGWTVAVAVGIVVTAVRYRRQQRGWVWFAQTAGQMLACAAMFLGIEGLAHDAAPAGTGWSTVATIGAFVTVAYSTAWSPLRTAAPGGEKAPKVIDAEPPAGA